MSRWFWPWLVSAPLLVSQVLADNLVGEAALGGGVGGALGGAVGASVGGRDGAIIGSALGAAVGTAVATDDEEPPRHVHDHRVRERVEVHEHHHYYRERPAYRHCPPGQAKKGRC
jgi:hypothetical protein